MSPLVPTRCRFMRVVYQFGIVCRSRRRRDGGVVRPRPGAGGKRRGRSPKRRAARPRSNWPRQPPARCATRSRSWAPRRASRSVDLVPVVAGRIARIGVEEGAEVQAGQVLYELDAVQSRAAVREAEAELENLRTQLDRARRLSSSSAVSEASVDTLASQTQAAAARLAAARADLDDRRIKAPFEGVLGLSDIQRGRLRHARHRLDDAGRPDAGRTGVLGAGEPVRPRQGRGRGGGTLRSVSRPGLRGPRRPGRHPRRSSVARLHAAGRLAQPRAAAAAGPVHDGRTRPGAARRGGARPPSKP